MERVPRQYLNRNVRREHDRSARARQCMLLACGLLLACGFVVAARQQFAAINYGYQNEELRRERDRLLAERQRLLFSYEERSSPAQLGRAAREIGLQPTRPAQISVAAATSPRSNALRMVPALVGAPGGGGGGASLGR